jgi:hypothetical protein
MPGKPAIRSETKPNEPALPVVEAAVDLVAYPFNGGHCPSTHGGSGYPPQTVVSPDGKLQCPFCGIEMNPALWRRGQAHYIDENMGAPSKRTPQRTGFLGWLSGRRP